VIPETRFAPTSDGYLAYQVFGKGPRDIVFMFPWTSHVEFMWEIPEHARALRRLSDLGRVIVFDKRGVGMSERTTQPVSLEQRSDDIVAVMAAAGSDHAVLLGTGDAAAAALVTAARYPDRVTSVIALEAVAAARPDADHPWGYNAAFIEQLAAVLESGGWGEAVAVRMGVPAYAKDPRILNAFKKLERMSATPSMASQLLRSVLDIDIRRYLPEVRVPVLVLHNVDFQGIEVEGMRWLAEHLPDGRFRQVKETGLLPFPGDSTFGEMEEFLEGIRRAGRDHVTVSTVLFTDVVGSTEQLVRAHDSGWEAVLEAHRAAVRQAFGQHRGREIGTAGDGFLAIFALPSDALQCAQEITSDMAMQGLQVRAGVHTGEVITGPSDVVGVAVHVAARVSALAQPGEVLFTETVYTLTLGTARECEPAGEHHLRGVPGSWRLYRLIHPG
jgi:class 3 adenylate cyclase/pimeloyl-ACP methyl ester carboxylesterase